MDPPDRDRALPTAATARWPAAPPRPTPTATACPTRGRRKYGLNPKDPSDAASDFDHTGYTNVEKYINGLADGLYPCNARARQSSNAAFISGIQLPTRPSDE